MNTTVDKRKTLKLDTPVEVSKEKYNIFKKDFAGYVAHRTENGKYYVKVLMFCGYKKVMEELLNA